MCCGRCKAQNTSTLICRWGWDGASNKWYGIMVSLNAGYRWYGGGGVQVRGHLDVVLVYVHLEHIQYLITWYEEGNMRHTPISLE